MYEITLTALIYLGFICAFGGAIFGYFLAEYLAVR